ncbi:DNA replication/repair protein RecF [Floccifex sp.]|uniref:DNA replication/repair protein RecF n=1 Tax=Floccifex sp. TaxID=2815810 RepID=UPI003F06E8A8|nr:DNA replication/repair protein RecF [Erysipelotrichaceae bacterium]
MNIKSLRLIHFRNFDNVEFNFKENCIHCFYGKNAQGKTNLIESIYFLSHLHSFRTNTLSSMVMDSQDQMLVQAKIESNHSMSDLKVVVSNQKKHLFHNNNSIKKYSDFVGILNAISFCPDDIMLFSAPKKVRRNFIDMELIKLSKKYTFTLSRYNRTLKNRNMALKQNELDVDLIDVYTSQMIEDEVVIIKQRNSFINSLMAYANRLYPFFSREKEKMSANYITFVDIDNIEENIRKSYENTFDKDCLYKMTNVGIHRDDIQFLLNGKDINEVASQGQKRSYLLAMKLGLAQMVYEKTNQYPILLLDDVFSELDPYRKKELIHILPKNMQIFITTVEKVDASWFKNRSVQFYEVQNGMVKEVTQ